MKYIFEYEILNTFKRPINGMAVIDADTEYEAEDKFNYLYAYASLNNIKIKTLDFSYKCYEGGDL